jgi:hypothetical protein
MRKQATLAWLCLVMVSTCPSVAFADEPMQVVEIPGMKDAELRSYRSLVAGFEAFDAHRKLAPAAALRFRLVRNGDPDPRATEGLAIRIVGKGDAIPVAVAADGVFSVPRIDSAYDDDAELILNRKRGQFRGMPDVRTPGLPQNVRRLGDLRLECRVMMGIVKYHLGFAARAFITTMMRTGDWCSFKEFQYGVTSTARVSAVSLVDGERRLSGKADEWRFEVPIGDASWPDDTLVELTFAPEA